MEVGAVSMDVLASYRGNMGIFVIFASVDDHNDANRNNVVQGTTQLLVQEPKRRSTTAGLGRIAQCITNVRCGYSTS